MLDGIPEEDIWITREYLDYKRIFGREYLDYKRIYKRIFGTWYRREYLEPDNVKCESITASKKKRPPDIRSDLKVSPFFVRL